MIAANASETTRATRPMQAWRLAILLALSWLLAPAGQCGELSAAFQSLRGLRAAALTIDGVAPDFARYGITAAQMQAGVESRLRAGGLDVIPAQSLAATAGAVLVEIRVRTVSNTATLLPYWSYSVALIVRQKIPLPNAPDAYVPATIWSRSDIGAIEPVRLSRLYVVADELADEFVAELRRQNAR
ncbi:MAG: hypothetical protein AB7Q97_08315 [Gammaproteobacteria bacterium]